MSDRHKDWRLVDARKASIAEILADVSMIPIGRTPEEDALALFLEMRQIRSHGRALEVMRDRLARLDDAYRPVPLNGDPEPLRPCLAESSFTKIVNLIMQATGLGLTTAARVAGHLVMTGSDEDRERLLPTFPVAARWALETPQSEAA